MEMTQKIVLGLTLAGTAQIFSGNTADQGAASTQSQPTAVVAKKGAATGQAAVRKKKASGQNSAIENVRIVKRKKPPRSTEKCA